MPRILCLKDIFTIYLSVAHSEFRQDRNLEPSLNTPMRGALPYPVGKSRLQRLFQQGRPSRRARRPAGRRNHADSGE